MQSDYIALQQAAALGLVACAGLLWRLQERSFNKINGGGRSGADGQSLLVRDMNVRSS